MTRAATNTVKVVVLGPRGSGTTPLLCAIADVQVLATDRVPLMERPDRGVDVDFGRVALSADLAISLFAARDADVVREVWSDLVDGLLGVVLMTDGQPDGAAGPAAAGALLRASLGAAATTVVVACTDPAADDAAVRAGAELDDATPVVSVDPTSREDARATILSLLHATLRAGARAPTDEPARR